MKIQKQKNNKATVTSSGPDLLTEIVTCRHRTGKQMKTDDSATPEQLYWSVESPACPAGERGHQRYLCLVNRCVESPRLEDVTPLRGMVRTYLQQWPILQLRDPSTGDRGWIANDLVVNSAHPVQMSSHSADIQMDDWRQPRHRMNVSPATKTGLLGELECRYTT